MRSTYNYIFLTMPKNNDIQTSNSIFALASLNPDKIQKK